MNNSVSYPLITIGIPCFNAQGTIEKAINSAIAQNYPNIEILVVDDCSTDSSVSVAEKIANAYHFVRIIRNAENKGPGGSRQIIVEQARGEFIAFFDDDDESFPERVKTQWERLISYEKMSGVTLAACYASGYRMYPNGYKKELPAIGSRPEVPQGSGVVDFILFYKKNSAWFYGVGTPSCALMARRQTFLSLGGFDSSFRRVEDLDFAIRLALAGGHFIGCPEMLFTQHSTNAPDKTPRKNLDAELKLVEKHRSYLEGAGWYRYARQWPWIRYYHFSGEHGLMILGLLKLSMRHPLKTMTHMLETVPRRFLHERKMARGRT